MNDITHQINYEKTKIYNINENDAKLISDEKSFKTNDKYDEMPNCEMTNGEIKTYEMMNKRDNNIKIVYSYTIHDSKNQMNPYNELISMNITVDKNNNYSLTKKITKLPFFRYGHFLCLTKNNCILSIGGTDGKTNYAIVEKYCEQNKRWKQINLMHFARSNFCGICTENNDIFVLGGEGNEKNILKSVEYYDSTINSWRSLPPLNCVRHSASAIIYQDTIFIIGGKDGIGNYGKVHKSVETLNINQKNKKWEMFKSLKQSRLRLATIVFKDKIYAIGGSTGIKDLKSVEIYDFKIGKWVDGPSLNYARSNFVAFMWNNRLVVYGGINNNKEVIIFKKYINK
uniref:Kelch protein n=1 Tax=Piliocolobus tephrosceles TaxID=591936 RepID=A0A8C9GWX0_9PRIM